MGILCFPLLLWISILSLIFVNDVINGKCLEDQSLALVEFKQNIPFSQSSSSPLSWNSSKDCCSWAGVTCEDGLIVGLDLSHENISSPIPKSFANFSNLTSLRLAGCNLVGKFPEEIFRIPSLQTLNLSMNDLLGGSLPEFIQEESFRSLDLSHTNFSGPLPKSIGKLSMLSHMDLANCKFSGPIPNSLANLSQLVVLDLSSNNFSGPIPTPHFEGLVKLVSVDLSFNSFGGNIPSSLFNLSSLQTIVLSHNHFDGLLPKFSNVSSSQLQKLDLSFNNFSGTIHLKSLQRMANLISLNFSYNSLSIETSSNKSSFSKAFPSLSSLMLASCKLKTFPGFRNHPSLLNIDFSNNQIGGDIPSWIWELNDLLSLNLSHNLLVNLQKPFGIPHHLRYLDLNSNNLQGEIPIPPKSAIYVDYSSNHFNSSIPVDIFGDSYSAFFFSVSNNNLTGNIPESICSATNLHVLDLSQNNLTGKIPLCLVERTNNIAVLNLAENNLGGNISGTFPRNCGLKTLDLHENHLEGMIPESLSKCPMLEALNLGNNMIDDMFPCWLKNLAHLRVLILRSNRFQGNLHCLEVNQSWKNLQIIDLASNNFSGLLPTKGFLNFKAMIVHEDELNPLRYEYFNLLPANPLPANPYQTGGVSTYKARIVENYLPGVVSTSEERTVKNGLNPYCSCHGGVSTSRERIGDNGLNPLRRYESINPNIYYQDKVKVVSKGLQIELVKILTIYTFIDLSSNMFRGNVPAEIGHLTSLYGLNLSNNALTGQIPSSFGSLKVLESLDLSKNKLYGVIPSQLGGLTFLSFLNLSFNQLEGMIPNGRQLQTFTEASFQGNKGLCGTPLNVKCHDSSPPAYDNMHFGAKIEWGLIAAEIGFAFGLGIFVLLLVFCKKWRKYYNQHVDQFLSRILNMQRRESGRRGRRTRGRKIQRQSIS